MGQDNLLNINNYLAVNTNPQTRIRFRSIRSRVAPVFGTKTSSFNAWKLEFCSSSSSSSAQPSSSLSSSTTATAVLQQRKPPKSTLSAQLRRLQKLDSYDYTTTNSTVNLGEREEKVASTSSSGIQECEGVVEVRFLRKKDRSLRSLTDLESSAAFELNRGVTFEPLILSDPGDLLYRFLLPLALGYSRTKRRV